MGFIISWTPYAAVAFYSAFISTDLPPIAGTLPAMFAKSSLVWTSVLYIFSNKQIRTKIGRGLFTREVSEVSVSRSKSPNFPDIMLANYIINSLCIFRQISGSDKTRQQYEYVMNSQSV